MNSFNPRICKRCDFRIKWTGSLNIVSIHASVKDATKALDFDRIYIRVSIHASVKDATYGKRIPFYAKCRFNPRICKRCDSMFVKNFIDDTFKL